MKSKAFRILSLVLALVMVASFAACGGNKEGETTTEPAVETTVPAADVETTLPAEDAQTTAADATEVATEAATEEATEEATTEAALPSEAPTETADILKLYNDATAKVASAKPQFTKKRESVANTYDAGVALKAFKGLVYQFMGIGSENIFTETIAKNGDNYTKHFLASKLTAADVTSAACTADDKGNFTVNLSIKGGNSSVNEGTLEGINAPIDKCGISAGLNDKDYYDHKTAQNVYDAIDDVASGATIKESYSNAKLTAVIDAEGNLTSLKVTFDMAFDISKVYGSSGTATASTEVIFSDFKW
ncbi:MAG: hypothetical protein IJB86_03605 [Clostridia bacterium]|nr:hypothetical protein [Clostridia bacterium]